jgi:hypothetical protein
MISKVRLFDRSRCITDWVCPYRRYLNYELDGKGIVSVGLALELHIGSVVHEALAEIAHQEKGDYSSIDINSIVLTATKQVRDTLTPQLEVEMDGLEFVNEQVALVEGLIRGFLRKVRPQLLTQYPTIIAIEQEMDFKLDESLLFMARPDLILADTEGNWHYIEFKTTSSKQDTWINQWGTSIQTHSTIKAIEQTLGTAPIDTTIIGLYKGYKSYNKQNSPYCYAYSRSGNPPFTADTLLYEYKAGFKRTPTWNLDGGVKAWVEKMPEALLGEQYLQTPPLFYREDLVNAFFAQRSYREREIKMAMDMLKNADEESKKEILNVSFPQRFDQCVPSWGHPCPYRRICHGHVENPLMDGFAYREPHHLRELEQQQLELANADLQKL